MRVKTLRVAAAPLLFAFGSIAASAEGPSFDCAKAATPVEKVICGDTSLSSLDALLASTYRAASARDPEGRPALVASQRTWVSTRDRQCAIDAECLARVYRDRIAMLEAAPGESASNPCRVLAERYRTWLTRTTATDPSASGKGPLALAGVSESGVKLFDPVAKLDDPSKLGEWARTLQPPAALPPDSIYFAIESGRARAVSGPPNWANDYHSCGVWRAFGTVDGVPVAIESSAGGGTLEETLTLSPWRGSRFRQTCSLTLSYAPRVSANGLSNAWDEECSGKRCDRLRREAVALVEAVQTDAKDSLERASKRLTAEQAAGFGPRGVGGKTKGIIRPDDLTDQEPLVLPATIDGTLYRVLVGHITIGWRRFSDWRVVFEDLSGSGDNASLAVAMHRGELLSTTIR